MTAQTVRVVRDTVAVITGLVLFVAAAMWGAWLIDISISRQTFLRTVAALILVGFVLFLALFVVLLASERSNHYAGEPTSRLHLPLLVSTGALTVYFGLASINAVDVYYQPRHMWPLMRDPTVQIITSALILVIVAAKGWLLWEILPHRWPRKTPRRR